MNRSATASTRALNRNRTGRGGMPPAGRGLAVVREERIRDETIAPRVRSLLLDPRSADLEPREAGGGKRVLLENGPARPCGLSAPRPLVNGYYPAAPATEPRRRRTGRRPARSRHRKAARRHRPPGGR